jgi:nicotianamine synthase
MSFENEDVAHDDTESENSSSWTKSQVVFLAALVGTDTRSKVEILRDLAARLQPGSLVVARSARGMRSVLYPVSLTSIFFIIFSFYSMAEEWLLVFENT